MLNQRRPRGAVVVAGLAGKHLRDGGMYNVMKRAPALLLAALPLLFAACATKPTPVAFHPTDPAALVVQTFDARTARVVTPTPTETIESAEILARAKNLTPHQTAVIILENYPEPEPGPLFRDRSMGWFIGLRGLGYQHILFLLGNGSASPDGLITLADYN